MRDELARLIEQARAEGKWLWCHYQDLWFSPDRLSFENAQGRFLWGPVNWKLRDPKERLAEADKVVEAAQKRRNQIATEIFGS